MNIHMIKKLTSATTMGFLVLGLATPGAWATVEVLNNGAGSNTTINSTMDHNTSVVQGNEANIKTQIHAFASSGGNTATDNTGGDVAIVTGNAGTMVDVTTMANLNKAMLAPSGGHDMHLTSAGNGAYSDTNMNVDMNHETSAFQNNKAHVDNYIYQQAKSGDNQAKRNTGGDTSILTGHALTEANVKTALNANVAKVMGDNHTGSHHLKSMGNGAYSDTSMNFGADHSISFVQGNQGKVNNALHNYASSGYNKASDNTGGETGIRTGMAHSFSDVETMANVNYAFGSSSASDMSALISGNGAKSDTTVNHWFDDSVSAFQNGLFDGYTMIHEDPETGRNEIARSTAWGYLDPFIYTGHASSDYRVKTLANANVFSTDEAHSGVEVDFDFDMGALWGLLH